MECGYTRNRVHPNDPSEALVAQRLVIGPLNGNGLRTDHPDDCWLRCHGRDRVLNLRISASYQDVRMLCLALARLSHHYVLLN